MVRARRAAFLARALAAFGVLSAPTSLAHAQVRWDASAAAGVTKRWLADRLPGADDAGFGPEARLAAHVALLPLVRAGAYATFDVTSAGDATRLLFGGGLHVKLFAPVPSRSGRLWLATGFGLIGAHAPAYRATAIDVPRAGGRFLEVPLGVGASWKVWGPWALTGELGVRLGFAHAGSLYDAPSGVDRVGTGLLLGVLYDR